MEKQLNYDIDGPHLKKRRWLRSRIWLWATFIGYVVMFSLGIYLLLTR